MQLQDSTVSEISSPNKPVMAVTTVVIPPEGVNGGEMIEMDVNANSGEEKGREEGEGEGEGEGDGDGDGDEGINKISFGGNRWPRQETLALLKIRSDMDAVFRDSSLKGPLWEQVSRKLAELGYHRSAKKCKEKFENVYKYNKRTKENKSGKSHGKTYKFFDQLQALENQFTISYPPKSQAIMTTTTTTNTVTLPPKPSDGNATISHATTAFPSTNPTLISPSPPTNAAVATATATTTSITNPRNPSPPQANNNNNNVPHSIPNINNLFSTTTSTSSSTASDEDLEERYRKKRKWKDYFRRLTRKLLIKQEETQNKFLEALDKRERERVAQQDNWRMQEMARINRDHEILVQERSAVAAKDAEVIALLQKWSGQQNPTQLSSSLSSSSLLFSLSSLPISQVEPPKHKQTMPQTQPPILMPNNNFETVRMDNGHSATTATSLVRSSSRWPKAEVHALIRIRTSLETKYQENGPKAPLWEEISSEMQRHGYNRSAKRCKEKWENINKYFKKVRESSKERREDSKTCPYFHELDALYKLKSKSQNPFGISFHSVKPNEMMMMMEPLMVQPEQQWRPPPHSLEEDMEKENTSEYQEKEEENDEEEDGDDDDAEEYGDSVEDGRVNRYEIATNN